MRVFPIHPGKAIALFLVVSAQFAATPAAQAQSGELRLRVEPNPAKPGERVTLVADGRRNWNSGTGRVRGLDMPINFQIIPARLVGRYGFNVPSTARTGSYVVELEVSDGKGAVQRGEATLRVDTTLTSSGNVPGGEDRKSVV